MSVKFLDGKLYANYGDNWDDELFREIILEKIDCDSRILDVGAGAGIVSQMNFRGHAREVCGVDLDERVLSNDFLDDAKHSTAERIPYENDSFDLVFSDNVLEHLDDPQNVFAEVCRVLKPGGAFVIKTPNKYHYVPLIARWTPHQFHQYINRLRGRKEVNTFPTRYKANSKSVLGKLASQSGMEMTMLRQIEGRPEYLRMNVIAYGLGCIYERLVNRFEALSNYRILLIAEFRK